MRIIFLNNSLFENMKKCIIFNKNKLIILKLMKLNKILVFIFKFTKYYFQKLSFNSL
jgi:hypothetical protein